MMSAAKGALSAKRLLVRYWPLLWLLAIPALTIIYERMNHGGSDVHNLMTDLDRRIPFIPAFVLPYMIWYPFIFFMLIVLFRRDRALYYRSLTILCTGLMVCYVIYHLFQTTVPRPPVEQHGWFEGLVRLVYATDAPFNCFPSIHVLTSHIVMKSVYRSKLKPALQRAVFVAAWTIIVSTLFVKQHALLDIAGAILLSEILFFLMGLLQGSAAKETQLSVQADH